MRRAMAEAEVGDDDYGEDPTVRALEEAFAARVGKPAALFVPSGVMANQIAVRVLSAPGTAVVAGRRQHVVAYEYGAAAMNAGVQFIGLDDDDGMLRRRRRAPGRARPSEHHQPAVSLVSIENTHMAASGAVWTMARLARAGRRGRAASPSTWTGPGSSTPRWPPGCRRPTGRRPPPPSCAACPRACAHRWARCWPAPTDVIAEGRLARKRLGGGMRQAGVLAAPGLVALRDMVERLPEDHARAARLADAVAERWPDCGLDPAAVRTNIVTFTHADPDKLAGPPGGPRRAGPCHRARDRPLRHAPRRRRRRHRPRAIAAAGAARREGPHRDQRGRARASVPRPWSRWRRRSRDTGFDSLWLPEVLTRPGPDPLVGLAWVSGACPGLKIGTTMLLPGPQPRVAGQGGRHARHALGRPLPPHLRARARHRRRAQRHRHPDAPTRAVLMDDALPGAAPAVGRRGGQPRGPGRLLRRRLGLAPTGAGPLRRVAGWQPPGRARALRSPGRRVDPGVLHARGRRGGQGGDRPGGRRARAGHQPRALRRQPGLRPRGHRRGRAGVVAAGPPGPRAAARADHPGRARRACAP